MAIKNAYLNRVYQDLAGRYADQKEFLQAVQEVLTSLEPVFERRPELEEILAAEAAMPGLAALEAEAAEQTERIRVRITDQVEFEG